MTEKALRNSFIFGTLFFLAILIVMTVDSLSEVRSVRTPPLAADVVAGKRVFQRKNCNDCHTILGIGGYFAPELTKVADRRDAEWLWRYLADPQVAKPGTTMPNQRLVAADVAGLVAFFRWVSRIDTNRWPPAPRVQVGGGAASSPLALLYERKGCSGCHMVGGKGAAGPGPDLSHIGAQPYDELPNTPEFLERWLDDPAAQKPGTLMPRLPMTEAERDSLVQYLVALR